jgi:hypothetical protein
MKDVKPKTNFPTRTRSFFLHDPLDKGSTANAKEKPSSNRLAHLSIERQVVTASSAAAQHSNPKQLNTVSFHPPP